MGTEHLSLSLGSGAHARAHDGVQSAGFIRLIMVLMTVVGGI